MLDLNFSGNEQYGYSCKKDGGVEGKWIKRKYKQD